MKQALYKVGEEVILKSLDHPEFNGDYIVQAVHQSGDTIPNVRGCLAVLCPSGFSYYLGFNHYADEYTHWGQLSLRKKHKPSDQSFDQIMSSFKQPQKV